MMMITNSKIFCKSFFPNIVTERYLLPETLPLNFLARRKFVFNYIKNFSRQFQLYKIAVKICIVLRPKNLQNYLLCCFRYDSVFALFITLYKYKPEPTEMASQWIYLLFGFNNQRQGVLFCECIRSLKYDCIFLKTRLLIAKV